MINSRKCTDNGFTILNDKPTLFNILNIKWKNPNWGGELDQGLIHDHLDVADILSLDASISAKSERKLLIFTKDGREGH